MGRYDYKPAHSGSNSREIIVGSNRETRRKNKGKKEEIPTNFFWRLSMNFGGSGACRRR